MDGRRVMERTVRTRRGGNFHGVCLVVGVCGALVLPPVQVSAEQIRFKDGTKLSGTILKRDGEVVVIGVARKEIESVDGQALPPPVTEGAPAPTFSATTVHGDEVSLADSKARPLLLQFWASWCPHCRRDLPMIQRLFTKYQGQRLRIATVSVDQNQQALTAFLRDQRVAFPVVWAFDPRNPANPTLPDRYEVEGIPAYYLIDGTGMIVRTWSGSVSDSSQEVEDAIKDVLARGSGRPPSR